MLTSVDISKYIDIFGFSSSKIKVHILHIVQYTINNIQIYDIQ